MNLLMRLGQKIDDAMNPIVVKELRQAVQSKFVVTILMLFLFVQLIIIVLYAYAASVDKENSEAQFQAGLQAFRVLLGILFGTCMLFIPAYAGFRLAAERSETNVDLLFITTLRPRSIIWGKYVAGIVVTILVFSACAPAMVFTYLMRGIDLPSIFITLAMAFIIVAGSIPIAIFISCIPAVRAVKAIFGLMGFGAIIWIGAMSLVGMVLMIGEGIGSLIDIWAFWGMAAGLLVLTLIFIELLFVLCVAMISPPTSNRALPVRLSCIAAWWITLAICIIWVESIRRYSYSPVGVRYFERDFPFYAWLILGVSMFSVMLLGAVSEREHWGPRIRRTIPRMPLFRVPAFLTYSGAPGGILCSLIMLGATLFVGWNWHNFFPLPASASARGLPPTIAPSAPAGLPPGVSTVTGPARTGEEFLQDMVKILLLVCLYVVAYCLSALLMRRALQTGRVRPFHTWVIALLLVGLLGFVPFVIGFLIQYQEGFHDLDIPWYWFLGNPFLAAFDVPHREQYLWFTGAWAFIAALLCAPWFLRGVREFRPYAADRQAESVTKAA